MHLTVLFLSRLQFAMTIMFHFLFPPLSIGLGFLLLIMEGTYFATKKRQYLDMAKFWVRIYAINFAMGVATGLVMTYEFGTNWASFSRFVGDVFGSLLAVEGLFAFMLEAGFLAILVFGWDRVSPRVHFFSTCMVVVGTVLSATFILIANSWMHTPAGFQIVGTGVRAHAVITDVRAVMLNPSFVYRYVHVLIAAAITGAFFVMSVSAYYLLKGRAPEFAKRSFILALVWAFCICWLAPFTGDNNVRWNARYQPAKLAAYEGDFHTRPDGDPTTYFGIIDSRRQTVHAEIGVPHAVSAMIYGDPNHSTRGLDQFPKQDQPPVGIIFTTFHIMVDMALFMVGLVSVALFLLWRKRLWEQRVLLKLFVISLAAPLITVECGWMTSEIGRQPWTVYGILRTSQSVSPTMTHPQILTSLLLFATIYGMIFVFWVIVLREQIRTGPESLLAAAGTPPAGPVPSLTGAVQTLVQFHDHAVGASLTHPEFSEDTGKEQNTGKERNADKELV